MKCTHITGVTKEARQIINRRGEITFTYMKDYTEKRLESKKRLETIVGGYCYAQDGGNGGYEFSDIVKHIDESIHQAVAEERKWILDGLPEKKYFGKDYIEGSNSDSNYVHGYNQALDDLLASLDKPLKVDEE